MEAMFEDNIHLGEDPCPQIYQQGNALSWIRVRYLRSEVNTDQKRKQI